MTENEAKFLEKLDELANDLEVDMYSVANLNFFFEESANTIRKLFEEIQQYRAIGTIEEFKALKEKSNKDFELLLKAVKESYPMFKGAYVELDVFMGDVMRRFTRDRKQS